MRALTVTLALLLCAAAPAAPVWAAQGPSAFMIARDEAVASQVDQLLEAGKKNMADGQFEQAISTFQEADQLAPEDAEIRGLLAGAQRKAADKYITEGRALIAQKQYAEAKNAFDSALEILPGDKAAKQGQKAAEHGPQADQYLKAAKEKLATGDAETAVAYYEKAFALVEDPQIRKWIEDAKAKKVKK